MVDAQDTQKKRKIAELHRLAWGWGLRVGVFTVLGGGLAGAACGLLLYWIGERLSPVSIAATLGVSVGLIIGFWWHITKTRRSHLALQSIRLQVPQFTEWVFVVNGEYRAISWKFFVEVMTRVGAQPLASDSGSVREALDSLYSLFQTMRGILSQMSPTQLHTGVSVEFLAMDLLNKHLRPFLSKWHPRIPSDGEAEAEDLAGCREDLEALREHLLRYGKAFGEIAEVKNLDKFVS